MKPTIVLGWLAFMYAMMAEKRRHVSEGDHQYNGGICFCEGACVIEWADRDEYSGLAEVFQRKAEALNQGIRAIREAGCGD